MTTSEFKELCKKFERTLDKKEKDEWYGTEQSLWQYFGEAFIKWYQQQGLQG